ncbi:hypothetical protein BH24DEI2_BH24DEI2_19780 [soil metagenome]
MNRVLRPSGRWRTFLVGNLGALGLIALIALGHFFMFYRPALINRAFPVTLPQNHAVGSFGEPVSSHGLKLYVTSMTTVKSAELPSSARLSSRAQSALTPLYLVLETSVSNTTSEPVTFQYYGVGQKLELRLGARRPQPTVFLPTLPRDAEVITGETPLPSRLLEPGETVSGVIAFTLNQVARDLSLLVIPKAQEDADKLPSFEIGLEPSP